MMRERHRFDVISLVFGLLFIAVSLPVLLTETTLDFDGGWIPPAAIVVIGLIVAATALRPRRSREEETAEPTALAELGTPPDLD
jgi:hypothetical protein